MQLFIIYAREDIKEKEKILLSIEEPLNRLNVKIWHDKKIPLGGSWEEIIKEHLKNSAIFLFIISDHFFKSSFIQSVEFKEALIKHSNKESLIIPFLTNTSNWADNIHIKKFQVFPRDGIPFIQQKNKRQVLEEFRLEIKEAIQVYLKEVDEIGKRKLDELLARAKEIEKSSQISHANYLLEQELRKRWNYKIKYFFTETCTSYISDFFEWVIGSWPVIMFIIEWIVVILLIMLFIKKCT